MLVTPGRLMRPARRKRDYIEELTNVLLLEEGAALLLEDGSYLTLEGDAFVAE